MRSILRSAASEPLLVDQALRVLDAFAEAERRGTSLSELVALASRLATRDVGVDDAVGRLRIQSSDAGTADAGASTAVIRRPFGPRDDPAGIAWMRAAGEDDAYRVLILDQLAHAAGRQDQAAGSDSRTASADELVSILVDDTADVEPRRRAAHRLGLEAKTSLRAVALGSAPTDRESSMFPVRFRTVPDEAGRSWAIVPDSMSTVLVASSVPLGVGRAGDIDRLPLSAAEAGRALRFTTPRGPGRRSWRADDLAGLLLLADLAPSALSELPDVALLRSILDMPRADVEMAILEEVAWSPSVRSAAARLGYHHSSIAARMARLSDATGIAVGEPAHRLRLQSAVLALRLLAAVEPDLLER